jgi:hypothetical protein
MYGESCGILRRDICRAVRPSNRASGISGQLTSFRRAAQRRLRRLLAALRRSERFFDDLMARTVTGASIGLFSERLVRAAGRGFAEYTASRLVRHLSGTRRVAFRLPAGSRAGQRIAGRRPVSLILTTSVRALRLRQRAVAESPIGLRLAPSASSRAAPQKSPPWPTRCSSTPPIRRRPA